MPTLYVDRTDIIGAGGAAIPTSGIVVNAYKASKFGSPPSQGTAAPGAADGSVSSGTSSGGLGESRLTVPTLEPYYCSFTLPGGGPLTWGGPYFPAIDGTSALTAPNLLQGFNLLTANQASLETDTTGWVVGGSCTISRSTSQALDGTASLAVAATGSTPNMYARTDPPLGTTVVAGTTYTAIASVRASTVARTAQVVVEWYGPGPAYISSSSGPATADLTTGWLQVGLTATAPAGAIGATVDVYFLSPGGAGEIHYIDQVSLAAGTSIVWTPGRITAGLKQTAVLVDKGGAIYNVRAYGALGDGVADDTAAINAAIAAAALPANGLTFSGGIVFFPPGIYNISSQINIEGSNGSPIIFQGSGKCHNLFVGYKPGTKLAWVGAAGGTMCRVRFNSCMRDMSLDGQNVAAQGVLISQVEGTVWSSIDVRRTTSWGYRLTADTQGIYRNSFISFSASEVNGGMLMDSTSATTDVATCTFTNLVLGPTTGPNAALDLTGADNCTFVGTSLSIAAGAGNNALIFRDVSSPQHGAEANVFFQLDGTGPIVGLCATYTNQIWGLSTDNGLVVPSGASAGNISYSLMSVAASSLNMGNGRVVAAQAQTVGTSSGYQFNDRTGTQVWQWYGTGSIARLSNGTVDTITVNGGDFSSSSGNITAGFAVFAGGGQANKLLLQGGATTTPVSVTATGTDANINLALAPKGTGLVTSTNSVAISTAGQGFQVKEGSNAKQGTATLVAGTVTVANTSVTASSRILLTSQVDGGTPGFLRVSARTAGASFVITSSNALDTSTVAYQIFEPA